MKSTSIGIIGLGKMGGNLALQAIDKGYRVFGYDLHKNEALQKHGLQQEASLDDLSEKLSGPKIILIYVPAGTIIDGILIRLSAVLSSGDIVIDGGNSYWGDSIKRSQKLKEKGIYFVDCGTSGGVDGARNGACFMAGGEPEAMEYVAPILKDLAVENGFVHTGGPGSGHFVKLVHNGIEFGMLQAIGEGMDLLANYREDLNFPDILKTWNHGSVIRSWLIELMAKYMMKSKASTLFHPMLKILEKLTGLLPMPCVWKYRYLLSRSRLCNYLLHAIRPESQIKLSR
jgi:6-phosphogluconate dehydrogenase